MFNPAILSGKMPFFCLSLFILSLPIRVNASPDRTLLNDAKDLYFKKNYAAAEPILNQIRTCCKGEAVYYLAQINEHHQITNNPAQTLQLYHEAAQLGYEPAMYSLANYYANGIGTKPDLLMSTDWLRRATHLESTKSEVAVIHLETGSPLNPTSNWQKKAAQGDTDALYQLARIYDEGVLASKDVKLAASYYLQAAKLGHKKSAYMTGYFYCRGIGYSQNVNLANQWLTIYQNGLNCQPSKDKP